MDAFDAGSIAGTLKLDINPYAQGMLQATSIARIFPETVTTFMANPLLGFLDVLKHVGDSIFDVFTESADLAASMGDLANSVGVGVESLTALGNVATKAGSSAQGVADAYRFLGRSVADAMAQADSTAGKTFSTLGVNFRDAHGAALPLEQVMLELSDAIQKLPPGAERTKVAMDLLGRSGTELVPTLMQGSQALQEQMDQMRKYGAVVTEQSRDTADQWRNSTDEMGFAWLGLKEAIAEPMRDALTPMMENLVIRVRKWQPEIRTEIFKTYDVIGQALKMLGPTFDWLGNNLRNIVAITAGVAVYMGGPAVLGLVLEFAPALWNVTMGLSALRIAILAVYTAIDPLAGLAKILSLALATLTVEAIRNPTSMAPVAVGFRYVAAAGLYLYDVLENVVSPAITRTLVGAFDHLRPYLPSAAQMFHAFGSAVQGVANFITKVVVPVVGWELQIAFDWIGPKLALASGAFHQMWGVMQSVVDWVAGPGTDALGNVFAGAWDSVTRAIHIAQPAFDAVYSTIAAGVEFIGSVGTTAMGMFRESWQTTQPILQAFGRYYAMVYDSIIVPYTSWLASTGAPFVRDVFGTALSDLMPIIHGVGSVLHGVFEVQRGLWSWAVPAIDAITERVRNFANVVGWLYSNIMQPIIELIWGQLKPALAFVSEWLDNTLGMVGKLLDYLGSVISTGNSAAQAVAGIPATPATPTASAASPGTVSGAAHFPSFFSAMPSPEIPKPDIQAYTGRVTDFFKGIGDTMGGGTEKGLTQGFEQFKKNGYKLPELKMPNLPSPDWGAMGTVGQNQGVRPFQDQLDDLQRGVAQNLNNFAAAKNNEHPDIRQQRIAFNSEQQDWNRRIQQAEHNHASPSEVEALRRQKTQALQTSNPNVQHKAKSPTSGGEQSPANVNVKVQPLNEQKVADLVVKGVGEHTQKQIAAAQSAARTIRTKQAVAEFI